jgi:anti-anti-sigma regulatory factor
MTSVVETQRQPSSVEVALDDSTMIRTPAETLAAHLCGLMTGGVTTVTVDVSGLQSLSSDVVSALLSARREAAARGCRLVLLAPTPASAALISRSPLGSVVDVATSRAVTPPWRHG